MKYILLVGLALLLSFAAGAALTVLIGQKVHLTRLAKASTCCGIALLIALALGIGYLEVYYHADPEAVACLSGTDTVTVEKVKGGYWFDGPGTGTAVVFYGGAKVETEAYAPLMLRMAEQGLDAFLADLPFRMAILDMNAADTALASRQYDSWLVMGHSAGGLAAALYAASHPEAVDGVILLAAYSTKPLEETALLSLYGTEDLVLNREAYEKNRQNWPAVHEEEIIQGGNHAQFGNYGAQRGDGQALISTETQQEETVTAVLQFLPGQAGSPAEQP